MLKIKVSVPATTANLGAGFNCLGLALKLFNTLELSEALSGIKIEISGEGKDTLPKDDKNLSLQAANKVFLMCGYAPKGMNIKINNHIPIARGLGSSAAAIVAGAVAANELCENKLSRDDLIRLCAELEGHADNIVAAFLEGLTICGHKNGRLIYKNFLIHHRIKAIVAVPVNLAIKTKDAIAILPKKIPFKDAVFNISRVAFFVSGIISDDLETTGLGMEDRMHQPYRKALIPGLKDVFRAAKKTGAYGVSLSGAGPSVVAIANRNHKSIGEAMKKAFKRNGIKVKVMILDMADEGIRIEVKKT